MRTAAALVALLPSVLAAGVSVISEGASCPPDSVVGTLSDDLSQLTLVYTKFHATEHQPGQCKVKVEVPHRTDQFYAVHDTQFKGHAVLAAGANYTLTAAYTFEANGRSAIVGSLSTLSGTLSSTHMDADSRLGTAV